MKSRRGFSMIEVMICIAVVGALASMAIPSMMGFQMRAKRAEREHALATLAQSVETHIDETNLSGGFIAAWNPAGAPGMLKRKFDIKQLPWSELPVLPDGTFYCQFSVTVPPGQAPVTQFSVEAQSDYDNDGKICVLTATFDFLQGQWQRTDTMTGDDN